MKTFAPGDVIARRYSVEDSLAQDTGVAVYRVRDAESGGTFVLQQVDVAGLTPEQADDARTRFERDVTLLLQLAHPAFPLVTDGFAEGDTLNLVTEPVPGQTLRSIVAERGPLPEPFVRALAHLLALALEALHTHRGGVVVLRDLHPDRVVVSEDGHVRLAGFGIRRPGIPGPVSAVEADDFPSPARFTPPEIHAGDEATPASDLYALGAVLHFALAGSTSDEGSTHACSTGLKALVQQCLEPEPARRPASARAVVLALESMEPMALGSSPPLRPHGGLMRRWLRANTWTSGLRSRLAIGGVVCVLGLLVILTPWWARESARRQLVECRDNLKNLGTAAEMYTLIDGRFPPRLSLLTPNFLKTIPTCPAAGTDTYSAGFTSISNPDLYTICCSGHHHERAGQGENHPQYTATQGLIIP